MCPGPDALWTSAAQMHNYEMNLQEPAGNDSKDSSSSSCSSHNRSNASVVSDSSSENSSLFGSMSLDSSSGSHGNGNEGDLQRELSRGDRRERK